jgi:hypothetical protein
MGLGSTQPLTEMSTKNLSGGKGRPACKADNFTAICKPVVYKMWEPRRLTTLWISMASYRDNVTFHFSFTLSSCQRNCLYPQKATQDQHCSQLKWSLVLTGLEARNDCADWKASRWMCLVLITDCDSSGLCKR